MATWYERHDSGTASMKRAGSSQSSSFKKVWIVQAGEDYTTAHEEFLATLDGFEGNLNGPYGTYNFNFEDYSAKHLGNGYWEVEAQYKTLGGGQQPNLGTVGTAGGGGNSQGGQPAIGVVASINFETSGGTRRVTQAISDERYPADAPDVKKAINMIGDNVDGVDIVVPIFGRRNMSLYKNINARKKAGTSRPKSKSTVSAKAYSNMKKGFPKKKK